MKKTILFSTILCLAIGSFYIMQNQKIDPSDAFNSYKLNTSGAGEAMDAWAFERSYPNFKMTGDLYMKAYQDEKRRNVIATRDGEDCWESIGPENIGGRILCLAFHPTDENIIYAGSASAGLWKTTTMGKGRFAWEHVPVDFPVLGIGAILIDPNNPDVIYVGTGEVYQNFGVSEPGTINRITRGSYGIGILKTENGGETWSRVLNFDDSDLIGVSDMEFNPENSNEVYAATTRGTYRSLNAGESWELIHPVGPAIDIEIDPFSNNIIYVSTGNLNTSLNPTLSGIYKSFDGGDSFQELTDDGLPLAWSGNAKLSLVQDNPNIIYASLQEAFINTTNTSYGGLYKSVDGGNNWLLVNNTNVSFWQGWYSHDIAINPTDSDELMYVGIDIWKTDDGGNSLENIAGHWNWQYGKISVDEPEGGDKFVHADVHAVYYHPLDPGKIFCAGDGGVHITEDGGQTFVTLNGGLQTTQFYSDFSNSAQDPNLAIGGTQDNASYVYDGSASWSRVIGGDGMSTAINKTDDNIVYGSAQNLFLARSEDRGTNFSFISPPSANNEITAFQGPYQLAPHNQDIIYAGRQFLYKSEDRGDNWSPTSTNYVDGANMIIDMALSENDPDRIFVATSPNPFGVITSAKLLRSDNGGISWSVVSQSLPNRIIKDIAIDPEDDDIVYVSFSGFGSAHLAKSEDAGDSWILIDGLPDVPTNSIFIDPLKTSHVYVANDLGVYFSKDGGESWRLFSEGLPDATMAFNLSYSESNRKIRLATHGRGVYERDLVFGNSTSIASENLDVAINLYPNPCVDQITIEYPSTSLVKGEIIIRDISGKMFISQETFSNIGKNIYTISVSDLPVGSYTASVVIDEVLRTTKFMKME